MITCGSCKNKTSTDRCTNRPLKGLILCGKHAKVKNLRLWKDAHNLDFFAIKIQRIWRGYSIRNWLQLAGPGVLKRSVCHNDSELVSFDDKTSVYPFDYFAFEENEKVYWFDIRSIAENSMSKLNPENPYTREPLSTDTRQRLRKLCIFRKLYSIRSRYSVPSVDVIIANLWIEICQIICENGFFDVPPAYFTTLNRPQLYMFINILRQDLVASAAEHKHHCSRRLRYIHWTKRLLGEYSKGIDKERLSYLTAKVLLAILNDRQNNYAQCFMIMSALHRL
jgi:hypothetical protein